MHTETEVRGKETEFTEFDDNELFERQISKTLKSQFNLAARRRIEDLEEERALKRLMDDDF